MLPWHLFVVQDAITQMSTLLPDAGDEAFVAHCYHYFLSRDPDPAGKQHFLDAMARGLSREGVLQAFAGSAEFAMLFNSRAAAGGMGRAQRFAPDGHFYSPIPPTRDYRERFAELALPMPDGVAMNGAGQLALAEKFAAYYRELPFSREPSEARRYHLDNGAFNHFDGIVLYCMMREFRPRRIIEVGSGFSSAAMLDTSELFLEGRTELTFIEPYPDTLHRCLRPGDEARCRVIAQDVQRVDTDVFRSLERNDILFIDSSHVAKFGSDVNHLLFKVLPLLQDGVLIHVHDIFRNFDYPREWLEEGRAWNEAYLLKAFLAHNPDCRVLFFNDWFAERHWDFLVQRMPLCTVQPQGSPFKNSGVSLWLQWRA